MIDTTGPQPFRHGSGNRDGPAAERARLGDVRGDDGIDVLVAQVTEELDLPVGRRTIRRDHEHRDSRLDERDRTVPEVRRRVGIGEDLAELLELQRPLARRGVLEATADHDAPVEGAHGSCELFGQPFDLRLRRERGAHRLGDGCQRRRCLRIRIEGQRQPGDREQRRRVRLRRGDGALRPGGELEDVVRDPRERARGIIGDREGRRALPRARLDDRDDVRRRARLADADDERAFEARLRAVQGHDRRRCEPDRQPVADPEQVLRVDRGVVATSRAPRSRRTRPAPTGAAPRPPRGRRARRRAGDAPRPAARGSRRGGSRERPVEAEQPRRDDRRGEPGLLDRAAGELGEVADGGVEPDEAAGERPVRQSSRRSRRRSRPGRPVDAARAATPSAAIASVTTASRSGPTVRRTSATSAGWTCSPSGMSPIVTRSSASAAPGRPGSRWSSFAIALNRWVTLLMPASKPARACAQVAALWPADTTTPFATSAATTSSAPGSSGASVTIRMPGGGRPAGDGLDRRRPQARRVVGAGPRRVEERALDVPAQRRGARRSPAAARRRAPTGRDLDDRPRRADEGRQERRHAVTRQDRGDLPDALGRLGQVVAARAVDLEIDHATPARPAPARRTGRRPGNGDRPRLGPAEERRRERDHRLGQDRVGAQVRAGFGVCGEVPRRAERDGDDRPARCKEGAHELGLWRSRPSRRSCPRRSRRSPRRACGARRSRRRSAGGGHHLVHVRPVGAERLGQ